MRQDQPGGRIVFHHDFPSEWLGNRRTISVYLPPGYDPAGRRRHSVVYMHDGQNLFDPARAAFGMSWQAHTTADQLIHAGRVPPLILVGIDNTAQRMDEYTCHRDSRQKAGGRGERYGWFVLDEVKPFIDQTYRTRPDRDNTAVMGSSLGGLISLEMAMRQHDHFSRCGIVSPALWWANGQVFRDLEGEQGWMRSMRFWLDMGTREGKVRRTVPPVVEHTRRLAQVFDDSGLIPGRDYYYQEVAGGEHNENHWASRFGKVLLYFFGDRCPAL